MAASPSVAVVKEICDEETTTDSGYSDASENPGDWQHGSSPNQLSEDGSPPRTQPFPAPSNTRDPCKKLSEVYLAAESIPAGNGRPAVDVSPGCGSLSLSPEQTLILLDWDDTIMPSTWVTRRGLTLSDDSVLTGDQAMELNDFAKVALMTLTAAQQMGTVVLVTNAEAGWIELSCRKFMPSLVIAVERIEQISARSTYEPQGIVSPLEWKIRAFALEISKFFEKDGPTPESMEAIWNVISLGDSAHERDAVMRATEKCKNVRTKSLKMLERPEIDQLKEQHQLIASFFPTIAEYDGHLDLCVRCSS
eukprot:GEMP01037950.1.p1 GENE.GEMP01037950.1~~GEMP01037950.1.p1  ORF type:complete len:307 (+),score=50.47 GEMP01037950.1:282-1202(+)